MTRKKKGRKNEGWIATGNNGSYGAGYGAH